MKYLKKYLSLALALVLCLSPAACGKSSEDYVESNEDRDDNGSDYNLYGVSDSFEGLARDFEQMANLYPYGGAWTGEDGGALVATNNDEGDEMRLALYDADEDMTASGFIQFVPDYDYDYSYNEHDGMAYRSWFDEDDALHVAELGTFTQVTGDVLGENIGDGDYSFFADVWYQDGNSGAANIIESNASGSQELPGWLGDDGDPTMADCGIIEVDQDGAGQCFAISTIHMDVVYDSILVGGDVVYWGGEYDRYQKTEQALQKKESDINEEAFCSCMDVFYVSKPCRLRQHRI